jgi:tetratricopeptide (TPR) repeat protein
MGKTTLLRRLRYSIEDSSELDLRWLPLVFPEEQYNVGRLADLYINCIDSLGDLLEERGEVDEAVRIDEFTSALTSEDPAELATVARDFLLTEGQRLGKGFVLLIDNADLILDGLPDEEEWAFRELLSHENGLVLIGATVRPIEAGYTYGKAFHEFFQIHELRGFSVEETREVLRRLAQCGGAKHVERLLDEDPARLKALNTLTGGNPRTVVLLYHLLAQGVDGNVRSDLERLLDLYTPNYKARFEELPKQAQQVVDALALHWDPATAADLANAVRTDVNAVSSQLSRLVKSGIVEQVSYYPGPKNGYQVAERFFNIWYLMRASRRIRRKLQWLVEFLRLFYSQEELRQHGRRYLKLRVEQNVQDRLKHAEYSFCLAQAIEGSRLRGALEFTALHCLMEDNTLRGELTSIVDLEGSDTGLKSLAERMQSLEEGRQAVLGAKIQGIHLSGDDLWRLLGSAPFLSIGAKTNIARRLNKMSPDEVSVLVARLTKEISLYTKALGSSDVAENLWEALRCGYMRELGDVDAARTLAEAREAPDILAVALAERLRTNPSLELLRELENILPNTKSAYAWFVAAEYGGALGWEAEKIQNAITQIDKLGGGHCEIWDSFGTLLHHLDQYPQAVTAHRQAIRLEPSNRESWADLGELLAYHLKRFAEAEEVLRVAASLGESADVWLGMGYALSHQDARSAEAEDAYRKSISLEPASALAWFGLGMVLHRAGHGREEDAEKAYRKAIALDPKSVDHWGALGDLLSQYGRVREAEDSYGKASAVDPKSAKPWSSLGDLLGAQSGREKEAEEAYRKAISLDLKWAYPWGGLGNLLRSQSGRAKEAEEAYRKAISLDPKWASPWGVLGDLLRSQSGREKDAEDAYRTAITLNPKWANPWGALGDLLRSQPGREKETEEAYLRGIALDPKWANPWGAMGEWLAHQANRQNEAEEAYRAAIALNPEWADAWMSLGELLSRQPARQRVAEEALRKALALNPKCLEAWDALGDLLSTQSGRESEAEQAYRDALAIDPNWATAWADLGSLLLMQDGREVEAEEALRKATALEPAWGFPWVALGLLIGATPDRITEATEIHRKSTKYCPQEAIVWNALATHLYETGRQDTEEAEHAARTAVALKPSNLDNAHTLAIVLICRNKWLEAREYVQRFIIDWTLDSQEKDWQQAITLFREAIRVGRAKESLDLLEEAQLAEKWRPLREALRAVIEGTPLYLQRVAPEVRDPAERILKELVSKEWSHAKPRPQKHTKKRKARGPSPNGKNA